MVLAPMVRINSLPFRELAHEFGADVVYTEELIDKKIIGSERVVNTALGTIDYVKKGAVIFRTTAEERSRLVLQLGTACPDLALQAARTMAQDVHAIDVNCGCPKHFSISGGMGAALLKQPDKLCSVGH
jgi:tRNA-dihydrouridine synthase 2